jgi:arylsulfatase A-like enzyme
LRTHRVRLLSASKVAGLIIGIVLLISCSLVDRQRNDNVVLIIIDTINPYRLGCYGFPLPTSPRIDKFASEGVLFRQAVTCVPITLPSVSAILTSTYPVSNNVRYNGKFFLSDSSITLAEMLKQRGYSTAAFIGGFPLDSRFKVDQGFDRYDDDFSNSAKAGNREWIGHKVDDFERTAGEVNESVFGWLETVKDERFFLMVHYFDPHWPYEPPSPYDKNFKSPYDAEVAYTDEHVGKLLDKLDALGLKENTLIVLTGDHGEGLGAHEELTHGEFIFDTTVTIPLILYHHKRIPKGRTVNTMVRSIDIMPTILDFLNIPESPHSQGVSLLPALDGRLKENPILLETMLPYYESESLDDIPVRIMGLRTSEWKLVYVTLEKDGKSAWIGQLYDVTKDPLELFNVMKENSDTFGHLMNEMDSMIQTYSAGGVPSSNYIEMDKESREKLKALGYLK